MSDSKKPAAKKPAAGSIIVSADPLVIVNPDEHADLQAKIEATHKPRR